VDTPNNRSSHKVSVIRGGGILFYIAAFLFYVFNHFQYTYFFLGLTIAAVISFLDDLFTLSSLLRFSIQLMAIILMIIEFGPFTFSIVSLLLLLFFVAGFLNIYNFMDGINGITGLYSTVVILALGYINCYEINFVNINLLIVVLFSLFIFGYYNYRKNAKFFAGDVGSISIGLIIIFCLGRLCLLTSNLSYLLFVLVYVLDGGITLLERLFKKQNIFSPHREHLYQIMVDKGHLSHLEVSLYYAIIQLLICCLVILIVNFNLNIVFLVLLAAIGFFTYFFYKLHLKRKKITL
jgi:UDP-N-acetylmuramyl pentapeptide phosphotransferase/UDP-N-acetylglucosamine-1-phosphate transferase